MAPLYAWGAGAIYAGCLWLIACRVAHTRALRLGSLPWWLLPLSGCAALGVAVLFAPAVACAAAASLLGALVCAVVDARTGYIFDALTGTIAVVACSCVLLDSRLTASALAAIVVGGTLATMYVLTSRRGIGLGDVKLGSVIALGYGLEPALIAIGSAFIIGALYAIAMLASRRATRSDAVRFGPFMAVGAVVGLSADALGWIP